MRTTQELLILVAEILKLVRELDKEPILRTYNNVDRIILELDHVKEIIIRNRP